MTISVLSGLTTVAGALSWSHATVAGTNFLVVTAAKESGTISGVTFDGVALVEAITQDWFGDHDVGIFYMINPPIGTFTVVVQGNADTQCKAKAINLSGVKPASPVRGTGAASGNNITAISAALSSSLSGDLCLDALCITLGPASDWVVDGGQTLLSLVRTGARPGQHGASTEPGASSVTMGWSGASTGSDGGETTYVNVSLKPMVGGNRMILAMWKRFVDDLKNGMVRPEILRRRYADLMEI